MANYQEQRERDYQNKLVARFVDELDYTYLGNLQYAKGALKNSFGYSNSPILEDRLRYFLKEKQKRTDMQVETVLAVLKEKARLTDRRMGSLMQCNTVLYETLIMGIKAQPSPEQNHEDVRLFDFENLLNNDFYIAEEVSYVDPLTGCNKRPDIVIYVNGIALAVIELKRSLVSCEEGIRQHLSNQTDFIPSFFTTTQFTIASNDGVDFRYGTVGTPLPFWCKWKRDTTKTGEVLTEEESYNLFFNKENFMFFFRYGVLNDGGIKKVLRPHQLYAIKAAAKRMPRKEGGVIWHSQGSGKSLTMVALAAYIRANFSNPRVVVITDRKELDLQLAATMQRGGNNLHHATSCEDLLSALNAGEEWLICSLIQKFGMHNNADEAERDESGTKVSLDEYLDALQAVIQQTYGNRFSVKGDNIFVFIDECHRTQSGRLHQAMREIMGKEIMLIGFTGTPLLKKDKGDMYNRIKNISERTFGPYIHKYLHKQAVEDKVILDLQYEYRNVDQQLTGKDKVDQKLAQLTAGRNLTPSQRLDLEERWATLERIYSTKERIERIGYSVLDDVQYGLLKHDWCNAMLIAGSIYQAYRYYEFFQNNTILKDRCAVVTSYNPSPGDLANVSPDTQKETEIQYKYRWATDSFKSAGVNNADEYEAWAKERFVKYPAMMKLLIVVNKLLTGFDAPCATTVLYIDNEIKDHTLFQAVCRVNRIGEDLKDINCNTIFTHKEFGRIVDFKNLFNSIEDVVTKFNDGEGFSGLDTVDIEGLLDSAVNKCRARLLAAKEAYEGLKVFWESKGLDDMEKLAQYYVTDLPDNPAETRREVLYSITSQMVTAYNNMADYFSKTDFTSDQIAKFQHLSQEAGTINRKVKQKSGDDFDPKTLDPDMRQLLDQHILAEEAETYIPPTADFSFIDLLPSEADVTSAADEAIRQAAGNAKGAAEVIEGKARRVNNDWNHADDAALRKFSEKLELLLAELRERNASAREVVEALIKHIQEIKHQNDAPDGLTGRRQQALWNNRAQWGAPEDKDAVVETINKVCDYIYQNAALGWQDPASVASMELREDLQAMLPQHNEEQIFELYRLAAQNG